jgi:uncharacterized protein involved in response to NO
VPAHTLLFPAATVFAALAVPLWALQYSGLLGPPPGFGPGAWHGHEMIFGYALAVVGGFLVTRASGTAVLALVCAWVAGRVVFLSVDLPPLVEGVVLLAYPVCLFAFAGVPFLRGAKSWQNRVFAPLIAAFALAELAYLTGVLGPLAGGQGRGLVLGLDLVTLLLFVMGGRVISAATSGAIRRKSGLVTRRAQPRLEALGVAALVTLIVLDFLGGPAAATAAAALMAAAVVMARLVRWRVWEVIDCVPVSSLHLGYAWLGLGLALRASSEAFGAPGPVDAFHGVTVGALGTLTLAMMARVSLQRGRWLIAFPPTVVAAIALVTAATLFRLLAAVPEVRLAMVAAAAVCWSAAFVAFAAFLFRLYLLSRTRSDARPF